MQQNNLLRLHFSMPPQQSYHSTASNFQHYSLVNVWCGLTDNKLAHLFLMDVIGAHYCLHCLGLAATSF